MNAPKKIWMAEDDAFDEYTHQFDDDIPYIRSDLVDGLVEALIDCQEALRRANANGELAVILAALKAMEEE